jgi:hypothetical protein
MQTGTECTQIAQTCRQITRPKQRPQSQGSPQFLERHRSRVMYVMMRNWLIRRDRGIKEPHCCGWNKPAPHGGGN